jgi:hypothetical protein
MPDLPWVRPTLQTTVALVILSLGPTIALQLDRPMLWLMSALSIRSLIRPVFRPPRVTQDKVYNARLALGLPDALDDGHAMKLFASSINNFNQGSPDALVDGRVVNLLARAEYNDNNKRSLLLETTDLLPQRKEQGAAISALPSRIQAEMLLLTLDTGASVRKQIIPSPATVAADLSSLWSNDTRPDKDDNDNDEEYTTPPAYLH